MVGRFRGAVLAVAALALIASGCSSSHTAAEPGGVLRIGISTPIDSLNPFVSQSDYSSVTYQYVYPHLVQYNAKVELVPSFATKWETSADGKTWTFHTVPNAKWSDGKPLTARDAAFTLTMMIKFQNGPTGVLGGLVANLKTAVAPDANTLVLTYSAPTANVLAQMQGVHILPQQVWAPLATGNGSKIKTFQNDSTPMVSGGPFMLIKYQVNQIALFHRNPNWWGQKPHIDGFGLQMFATDDAMVASLKANQLDMIGEHTPPTVVASLKSAGMDVLTAPSLTFMDFIINTNPKKKHNRELLNPDVRKAMEYAIDRQQIIDTAWLGFAKPGASVVAPASGWNDSSIQPLPYDLAKANALLDAAGYAKGSDGVRVADGHRMSYHLVFPTEINGSGDRTFQIIKNSFQQIGIELNEQKMDPTAAQTAIAGSNNLYQDFDLAMWDWVLPPDPQNILGDMTCAQWGNNSDSGYCNHTFDALYAKQSTLVDRSQRQAVVNQMQQIAYNDRPYIVLNYPDIIEAHTSKWTGFEMSPLLGSVNNMSIDTLLDVHQVG
ncbi:MAG: ABC transporter substrate-binding protein [Jatrophihabitantaceae bacterium]